MVLVFPNMVNDRLKTPLATPSVIQPNVIFQSINRQVGGKNEPGISSNIAIYSTKFTSKTNLTWSDELLTLAAKQMFFNAFSVFTIPSIKYTFRDQK